MIDLYIPERQNWFLDTLQTYFRLTIQNYDTFVNNYFNIDAISSCFINKIDVFSESNILETI